MSVERVGFHLKSPEQLKQQVDAVSARIGHPIVPASLGDHAITTEAQEFQSRFPIHMGVNAGELRALRREEHASKIFTQEQTIFPPDEDIKQCVYRDGMTNRWKSLTPLVTNLNRHVVAHQQREVPNVTFKPRQMGMFEKIRDCVEDGDMEGIIEAPTGWGKTVMFNQIAAAANVPTIILVPSQDLVEQTWERFQEFTPDISVGRVYEREKEYGRQVTVTTYSSLLLGDEAQLINPDGIGLVIFDEAHKAISEKRVMKVERLDQFRNAVFIGLSATPIEITDPRFAHTRVAQMTKKLWDEVPFTDAVLEGYLSSFHSVVARVDADLSKVKITASGDYDEQDLDKVINTAIQNKAAVDFFLAKREEDRLEREILGKKPLPFTTAWFSASVAQAKEHARLLNEAGIRAAAVWGTNKASEREEHKKIMKQWEKGEIEVVCSNMKLVEGTDKKSVRVIWNVAPTAVPWIEKQRTGRGMRTDDKNNPDKDTLVVDFVYSGTNMRSPQVIFPQLIGAARLTRLDIGAQQAYPKGPPVGQPNIQIEGIEVITDQEEIMRISRQMQEQQVQNVSLSPIDFEMEVGITGSFLDRTFVGGDRSRPISDEVLAQIAEEHPEAWREARSVGKDGKVNNTPLTALRKEFLSLYKQMMQERGVELQDIDKVIDFETEVGITQDFLTETFVGGSEKIQPISDETLEQIEKEHPEAWREARSVGKDGKVNRSTVALKKEYLSLYMERMQEKLKLQDKTRAIDAKQEVGITQGFFNSTFVRIKNIKIRPISDEVLQQISNEHLGAWRQAASITKSGRAGSEVTALRKEYMSLYLQMMQARGVRLK